MNRNLCKKGIVLGIIFLFVGVGVVPSISGDNSNFGDMIYVNDDNTEGPWDGTQEYPYQYIQDGIDAANDGDTVYVYSGTYYENVVVDKEINLIGEHKATTIIDGGGGESGIYGVITLSHDWVNVKSFRVTNGGRGWCNAGVYVSSDNNNITDIISDNNQNGIWLNYSSNNEIFKNEILNNVRYGISLYYARKNIISGNKILYKCHTGLAISGKDNEIYRNEISNPQYIGLSVVDYPNSIYENNFINNKINARNRINLSSDSKNIFDRNYWDRPRIFPYPILSWLENELNLPIPWLTFDWHPALEPYEI